MARFEHDRPRHTNAAFGQADIEGTADGKVSIAPFIDFAVFVPSRPAHRS
jgi:hypothetical protein